MLKSIPFSEFGILPKKVGLTVEQAALYHVQTLRVSVDRGTDHICMDCGCLSSHNLLITFQGHEIQNEVIMPVKYEVSGYFCRVCGMVIVGDLL